MQKRGAELVLSEIIGLALAAVLVFLLVYIAIQYGGLLIGGEEQGTLMTFLSMNERIQNELLSNPAKFAAIKNHRLDLDEEHMIIGFNTNWPNTPIVDCDDEPAYKPDQCGDSACLCLYKEDGGNDWPEFFIESEKNDDVVACTTFENQEIVFLSQYMIEDSRFGGKHQAGPNYYSQECDNRFAGEIKLDIENEEMDPCKYTYTVFWGDPCGSEKAEWDSRDLYIEKMFHSDGKIYIFFAENPIGWQGNEIRHRYEFLNSKFGASIEKFGALYQQGKFIELLTLAHLGEFPQEESANLNFWKGKAYLGIGQLANVLEQYENLRTGFQEKQIREIQRVNNRDEAIEHLTRLGIEAFLESGDFSQEVIEEILKFKMPLRMDLRQQLSSNLLIAQENKNSALRKNIFLYLLRYLKPSQQIVEKIYEFADQVKDENSEETLHFLQQKQNEQGDQIGETKTYIKLLEFSPIDQKIIKRKIHLFCRMNRQNQICIEFYSNFSFEKPAPNNYNLASEEERENFFYDTELFVINTNEGEKLSAYSNFINNILRISLLTQQDKSFLAISYFEIGKIKENQNLVEEARQAYLAAFTQAETSTLNQQTKQEIESRLQSLEEQE